MGNGLQGWIAAHGRSLLVGGIATGFSLLPWVHGFSQEVRPVLQLAARPGAVSAPASKGRAVVRAPIHRFTNRSARRVTDQSAKDVATPVLNVTTVRRRSRQPEVLNTLQTTAVQELTPYFPWWQDEVQAQMRAGSTSIPVTVDTLLMSALTNSSQVRVFSDLPLIRETAITEADSAFDWTSFIDTRWDDINEPVGSTLTTGGPPRFEDQVFNYSFGGRRRTTIGGQLEVSQRIGTQDNNSVFFLPADQGNSRLTLSYTQPVLRGGGRVYNTSLTVLAQIDAAVARDEFSRQLQSHLLEVTRGYWSLYLERAGLLQKRRLLNRAEEILGDLERRQELDAVKSQVVRARSAVESRRAEILRAEMAVKNAESRIRSLTNDPAFGEGDQVELIPSDVPLRGYTPVDMANSMATAMQSRPEIGQAIKQVKAGCVRMNMAKHEVLPMLNFVVESYLTGLRGNKNTGGAWTDQFSEGEPSYSVGLQYEMPIWNRAARARLQRRRLEVRQLQNQFRTTTETLKLEVAVAVREVTTSFGEMEAKYRAMDAAATEVEYISQRWKALGGEDRSASLMLEDLFNTQARLADAEFGFLSSELTYNLSQMNYKRAVGTLLQDENVCVGRGCECSLPSQSVTKDGGFGSYNVQSAAGMPVGTMHGESGPVQD